MNTVFATYEDISDCWPIFKHNIEGFFPLRNVYKPRIAGAAEVNSLIRTIPVINVKFIPLKAEALAQKSILNRHERPYLHIFIGFCEDIDVYRQRFRPALKSWLETITIKKSHQYFVILIENQTSVHEINKSGGAFLLDKIRFDFSDKVSLKLISLKLMPGENLNSIPECVEAISDCIYHSVIMNLNQLDEDIKRLAEKRTLTGWNFCSFFLTKESKALSLSDLGLFSEALACYDELEALFSEIRSFSETDNDNSSAYCFESVLPLNSVVNGSDLDSSNWPRYRELIHQNQISLYEFHVYLFSRQLYILLDLKNYANILKRCKEFVCHFYFTDHIGSTAHKKWVFEIIFFVLKVSEPDLSQIDIGTEISNLLVEILMLSDAQIDSNFTGGGKEIVLDQISDLSQLINSSTDLVIERHLQFKISIIKYCISVLKNSTLNYKYFMLCLKLSDLYYEANAFNIALEILQDVYERMSLHNWHKIQQYILEKSCICYWHLNMPREYLRKRLDIFQMSCAKVLLDEAEQDRIEKAIQFLDDTLCLSFELFFKIIELNVYFSSIGTIQMHVVIESNINIVLHDCEVTVAFSGETDDIATKPANLIQNQEYIFNADLIFKDDNYFGMHKLKSIILKCGKLVFESEKGSSLWDRDINISANNDLQIEGIIPDNFDFNNPFIVVRCWNNLASIMTDLSLSVCSSSDIDIFPLLDENENSRYRNKKLQVEHCINPNTRIDIKFSFSKYTHGRQSIKLYASFKIHGNQRNTAHRVELNLPKPWDIEHFFLVNRNLDLDCLTIKPKFNPNSDYETIKIMNINFGAENLHKNSEFEIEKNSALNLVIKNSSPSLTLKLPYQLSNDLEAKSVSINTSIPNIDIIYCKVTPRIKLFEIKIGTLLTFDVHLCGNVEFCDIPYSLIYDHSKWLLSGPCNGLSKENWCFDMVPLTAGLVQYPSLKFSTSIFVHFLNDGEGVVINA